MNENKELSTIKKLYLSKMGLRKMFGLTIATLNNVISQHEAKIRTLLVGESKRILYHSGDLANLLK